MKNKDYSFLETKPLYKSIVIPINEKMEGSAFIKTVGNSPLARVLDFLIENREFDYSLSDICRHADVGWTTLHTFWPQLEKSQIIKHTRVSGKSKMYKLNMSNKIAKALCEFDFQISKYYGEVETERRKLKAKA